MTQAALPSASAVHVPVPPSGRCRTRLIGSVLGASCRIANQLMLWLAKHRVTEIEVTGNALGSQFDEKYNVAIGCDINVQ